MFLLSNVSCGGLANFDSIIPSTTALIVKIIKVGIPVILIILGLLDIGKAVMAGEEKEMKEAQGRFIKRCIYAVLVFFVVAIVQFVFNTLGKADQEAGRSATSCISCFINGVDNCKK